MLGSLPHAPLHVLCNTNSVKVAKCFAQIGKTLHNPHLIGKISACILHGFHIRNRAANNERISFHSAAAKSLTSELCSVLILSALPQRPTNPNPNPVRKNHACETCGKAFRDVYHLNRHRLSHSDEKPFSCPICQQRFKRKDRMSHHVRSHQGGVEKPYICPHCGKAFSR